MENETLVATPPLEGVTEQPSVSQEPAQNGQLPEPVQDGGIPQVERLEQPTPSQEGTRPPKPSSFFKQRQEVQNLKRSVADLTRTLEGLRKSQAAPSQEPKKQERDYQKDIWDKPIDVINELIDKAIGSRVPEIFNQTISQKQAELSRREALDLIFTNETIKKDGDEGYSRVIAIIEEHGLDVVAEKDPVKAAKSALKFYELEYKKTQAPSGVKRTNPDVIPKKGQMVSTQTGAPGVSKEVSMDDLLSELKSIKTRIINNSDLVNDQAIKTRVQEIKRKLSEQQSKG